MTSGNILIQDVHAIEISCITATCMATLVLFLFSVLELTVPGIALEQLDNKFTFLKTGIRTGTIINFYQVLKLILELKLVIIIQFNFINI